MEAIEEFFTFNPEAKALLQIKRALERIAELKALLEIKGVDAPGLEVAQNKIQANVAKAAEIIKEQKAKGRDVSALAQKLDDDFDLRQELLKQTFKAEKAKLKVKKEEIKLQIWQAREAGDFDKVSQLEAVLADIEAQKEKLKQRWQSQKEILELEEEKLEAELEAKENGQAMAAEILAKDAERKIEQEEKLKEKFEEWEEKIKEKEKAEAKIQEIQKKLEKASEEERAELEKKLKEIERKKEEKKLELKEIENLREKLKTKKKERLEEIEEEFESKEPEIEKPKIPIKRDF